MYLVVPVTTLFLSAVRLPTYTRVPRYLLCLLQFTTGVPRFGCLEASCGGGAYANRTVLPLLEPEPPSLSTGTGTSTGALPGGETSADYSRGRCDQFTIRAPTPAVGTAVLRSSDPSDNEASCSFRITVLPPPPDLHGGYFDAAPRYTRGRPILSNALLSATPAGRPSASEAAVATTFTIAPDLSLDTGLSFSASTGEISGEISADPGSSVGGRSCARRCGLEEGGLVLSAERQAEACPGTGGAQGCSPEETHCLAATATASLVADPITNEPVGRREVFRGCATATGCGDLQARLADSRLLVGSSYAGYTYTLEGPLVCSVTERAASATTTYTVTASNSGGTSSTAIAITALPVSPQLDSTSSCSRTLTALHDDASGRASISAIDCFNASASASLGVPDIVRRSAMFREGRSGQDVQASSGRTSFSVSPSLPAGLELDSVTGAIEGTPSLSAFDAQAFRTCEAMPPTRFTVRAQNEGGHAEAGLQLTFVPEAPLLRYWQAGDGTTSYNRCAPASLNGSGLVNQQCRATMYRQAYSK